MCGIAGWLSNKPLDPTTARDLSTALLFYSRKRGDHSAGIWTNASGLLKRAQDPAKFVESEGFLSHFAIPATACLLHTRQPTSGAKGNEQAHPFKSNRTVGIHNGWYHNPAELKERWKLMKTSGVDSELATSFVSEYGIKALPDFIESAQGPSALSFWHDGAMYLYRDGNPLCVVHLTFQGGLRLSVFASTKNILEAALRYVWLIDDPRTCSIPEHTVLKLTPKGTGIIRKHKPFRAKRERLWLYDKDPEESPFWDMDTEEQNDPVDTFFASLREKQ